ncbi:MAG: hypothetical protein HY820_07315 [Acidobacteria bacterium]|nr:hypothetical protein [Acidobacteriota bacterium]
MQLLQWTGWVLGISLQLLVIAAILRGKLRSYPILFALIIFEFLSTIVMVAATLDSGAWTKETAKYYWITEVIDYALIYACLVQLLAQAVSRGQGRRRIAWVIVLGVLFVLLSIVQSYHVRPHLWMNQLVRNVAFGSMFVNLTLWTVLIRQPNRERLMVTAGMGIQLAGSAIGHSLLSISRQFVWAGNVVLLSVYLLFLYTIWRALKAPGTVAINGTNQDPDEALHRVN